MMTACSRRRRRCDRNVWYGIGSGHLQERISKGSCIPNWAKLAVLLAPVGRAAKLVC